MEKITPFLWFDGNAEAAMNHYVRIFPSSEIESVSRGSDGGVMSATFRLEGQRFMALNGGPHFKFTEAISLFVDCKTQKEVDELWTKLGEGGQPSRCGWLKDKFGLSWQIVPSVLGELLQGKDPEKSKRAMEAMLRMDKLDIEQLQQAYDGN
jgi:predicted 3-demethylubiquinone-9 3-methyltransferase (glyoxalase superfamily)